MDFDTYTVGLQVRADDGHETYLAVRITGSVPPNLTTLILRNVPGCEADGWCPEYALLERDLLPAEQAWSNPDGPSRGRPTPRRRAVVAGTKTRPRSLTWAFIVERVTRIELAL
ncbi:hypothetical protein [Streptomyces sp. NPDC048462]|uniref:hypothetical protein n=1 Tax=Streptomyces sp. NPDC048462 TaxID=3365555 RepID=UPI00371A3EA2